MPEIDATKARHIIDPTRNLGIWDDGMRSDDVISIAVLRGEQVWGMCGYGWFPTHFENKGRPCHACLKEAQRAIDETEGREHGQ